MTFSEIGQTHSLHGCDETIIDKINVRMLKQANGECWEDELSG